MLTVLTRSLLILECQNIESESKEALKSTIAVHKQADRRAGIMVFYIHWTGINSYNNRLEINSIAKQCSVHILSYIICFH